MNEIPPSPPSSTPKHNLQSWRQTVTLRVRTVIRLIATPI